MVNGILLPAISMYGLHISKKSFHLFDNMSQVNSFESFSVLTQNQIGLIYLEGYTVITSL